LRNFEIDADEAAAGQNGGSVGCFIPGPQFDPTSLCNPGDPIHNVGLVGSNGFPGYRPVDASNYGRDSWAGYIDLEADITDRFMASIAGRYEDFSDFGSNFSWRAAARLKVNDAWTLRGSAGTGFRAPTPGQISSIKISTGAFQGAPITFGIFPPQNPASQIFGATPLQDETSTQFTFGLALQPSDAFTMTLDYYFIALDDRIWFSSNFDVGPAERAQLIALGVPGADQLTTVRFLTNDMDTETNGIDLVAHYNRTDRVILRTRIRSTSSVTATFFNSKMATRIFVQTSPRRTAGPTMSVQRYAVTGTATINSPTIRRAGSRT
jgi:outer membrane receptor protein involved in Fe transport